MTGKSIARWPFRSTYECLHNQLTGYSLGIASLWWPRKDMKRCNLLNVITGQSAYSDSYRYAMLGSSWSRRPRSALPGDTRGCDIALIDTICATVTEQVCLLIKICSRRWSSYGNCKIFNPPSFVHVLVGNFPLQNGEKKNGENFIKDTSFIIISTYMP